MRKKLKGSGEIIGYTVTSILLTIIFIFAINIFLYFYVESQIQSAADVIARRIVVCDSLEAARTKAQGTADEILVSKSIREGSVRVYVEYVPGSIQEWKKGSFIMIFISANIRTGLPFSSGNVDTSTMVMVEGGGE